MSNFVIFYKINEKATKQKNRIWYYQTSDYDGDTLTLDIKGAQKIEKNSSDYNLLKFKGYEELEVK